MEFDAGTDRTETQEAVPVAPGSIAARTEVTIAKLKNGINNLPNEDLKRALSSLIEEAGGNVEKAKKSVEDWFDESMDRVTGWYKRHLRWFVIGTAVVVVTAFNADTARVGLTLWQNEATREVVAGLATNTASGTTPGFQCVNGTPTATNTPTAIVSLPTDPKCQQLMISNLRTGLGDIQLIGWRGNDASLSDPREMPNLNPVDWGGWLTKIIGLVVSVIAVQMGANFWFDALKKIVNVRSSGPPPPARNTSPTA
jgi:hypothetical protein